MRKIKIWNTVPGNSKRSKFEDMDIDRSVEHIPALIEFVKAIIQPEYSDGKRPIDSFTYECEIKPGLVKETYEDEPYIVPFPVEGSEKAVLVIPGGGFSYICSDTDGEGKQSEGDRVAKALNERGIAAFVLNYRFNPYRFPLPLLDVQRAVRYLRFHAADYGFCPDRIGAVGFSAGGYFVGAQLDLMEGKDKFPASYQKDEVDAVSDELNFAAQVYPALRFKNNVPMMFAAFPEAVVKDEAARERASAEYDLIAHASSRPIPRFFACGTDDHMISVKDYEEYVALARRNGLDVTEVSVAGANHGFGVDPKYMEKYGYWLERYLDWAENCLEGEK